MVTSLLSIDIKMENEMEEYGVATMQEMALKWLETVEKTMNVRPVIYTKESIRNKYLNDSRFKKYHFWIACYSEKGPTILIGRYGKKYKLHIWRNIVEILMFIYSVGIIHLLQII